MNQAFVNLGVTQAMSPNINSFVGDLVAMAQAMEQVPQLQDQIKTLQNQLEEALKHNQGLEENIVGYKQSIEDLSNKVRSLEVERDDASFRVLEAEDKAHHVLNWARDTQALMGQVIGELDPPKPEPIVDHAAEALAAKPFEPEQASHSDASLPDWKQDRAETSRLQPQFPEKDQFQDQSVKDPIANTGQQETTALTTPAPNTDVGSTTMATSSASPDASPQEPPKEPGPYAGKLYIDHPVYVSLHDWIEGGGTEGNYYRNRSPY